ncbi:MAG: hypothetical protein AUG82_00925 [Ktedonobacter sp. 13_1_20CM_4_53_11]|nr:MAG: hypothetical protein AUG82_00925 [Ktedonobacter sp. 13_1_20CM_4_53_11]
MQEPLRLEQKETILRSAEAVLDEAIAFLQGMIRIPTVNPPGEAYPACARYIGEQLHSLGYTVEYINLTPAEIAELAPYGAGLPRTNVIGRLPGANASPVLHFNGHMDVVPIEGTIEQSGVVDEESTGNRNAGMGLLVERGFIAPSHTDYVVITEPLNADNICLGHRGAIWGEITTFGHQAHGSTPERGVNAVELMADFITEVRHELKPRLQQRVSSLPIVPSSANAASLSFNTIQGGTNVNSVPDRCSVTFDRRLVMGERLEEARSELCNLLEQRARTQPDFCYEYVERYATDPTWVSPQTPLVQAFAAAVQEVVGHEPGYVYSPGSDDQRFVVQNAGIEQCIVYGPGEITQTHVIDESLAIDDLLTSIKVMALSAATLLGVESGANPYRQRG